jgi:hypothetical protein
MEVEMAGPGPNLASTAEAVAVGLISLALVPMPSPPEDPVLRLRAYAVDASSGASARMETLEIAIERWTNDGEREPLRDARRAGYIRRDTGVGWDVRYARLQPLPDGGQRVVFATERPTSVLATASDAPSLGQYLVGEIWLGADGKGVGALATAATMRLDPESVGTEGADGDDAAPVRLAEVVVEGHASRRP